MQYFVHTIFNLRATRICDGMLGSTGWTRTHWLTRRNETTMYNEAKRAANPGGRRPVATAPTVPLLPAAATHARQAAALPVYSSLLEVPTLRAHKLDHAMKIWPSGRPRRYPDDGPAKWIAATLGLASGWAVEGWGGQRPSSSCKFSCS